MFRLKMKIENVFRYFCDNANLFLSKEIDFKRGLIEKYDVKELSLIQKLYTNNYISNRLIFVDKYDKNNIYNIY
jgi:hypothetical protein